MDTNDHQRAAELHNLAAHAHLAAAAAHGKEDHLSAHEQSQKISLLHGKAASEEAKLNKS